MPKESTVSDARIFDSREDVNMMRTKAQLARNEGRYEEATLWEIRLEELKQLLEPKTESELKPKVTATCPHCGFTVIFEAKPNEHGFIILPEDAYCAKCWPYPQRIMYEMMMPKEVEVSRVGQESLSEVEKEKYRDLRIGDQHQCQST